MKPNHQYIEILSSGVLLTAKDVEDACNYAMRKKVSALVVPQRLIKFASELLRGSGVKTVTRVNYPKADLTLPAAEAVVLQSVMDGANEIELTMPPALVKERKGKSLQAVLNKLVQQYKKVGVKIRVHIVRELREDPDDLQFLAEELSEVKGLSCVVIYNGESPAPVKELNTLKDSGITTKVVNNFCTDRQYVEARKYGAEIVCTEAPEELLGK